MAVEDDNDQNNDVQNDELINNNNNDVMAVCMSRKEKRKLLKKLKRKQLRRQAAINAREIEEAAANDPETQARLRRLEEEEAERTERDRREWEERERQFAAALEMKKRREAEEAEEEERDRREGEERERQFAAALEMKKRREAEEAEEEERRKRDDDTANRDSITNGNEDELNEGDDWEYVEEGPAEIIWKGNEIIVKKKKVKVPKKAPDLQLEKQECERPISNPLAPQSEAFKDYRSAQEVLDSVAQQVPNFGTEQDKAHCPFHLKTGACRFGARCSRTHFYPDKSCTLLFKNMYSGPGLAWEQDEGLEYTEDEAERAFEEFYEDVHTEFLKFGELVNFKVCRNASSHLRGNVYVHYKSLESATLAYQSINGRFFAGKQLSCEFVNLTKWKVAICGEYMRSRLKTCSRGSVCNFIHCFRNPGGDYEWADWDKPAPRYWQKEMDALFGHKDDGFKDANLSYHLRRSWSRGPGSPHRRTHSDEDNEFNDHRRKYSQKHRGEYEENRSAPRNHLSKRKRSDSVDESDYSSEEWKSHHNSNSKRERRQKVERHRKMNRERQDNASDKELSEREGGEGSLKRKSRTSSWQKNDTVSVHDRHSCEKSPHVKKHRLNYRKHDNVDSVKDTGEAFSSDTDFAEDGLGIEKNRRRRSKNLHMKDEAYLLDNNSYGSRFGDDVSPKKNRKTIDMSNGKSEYRESSHRSDSLERADKCHIHNSSSRALDGERIEAGEKKRHRSRTNSRSENQAYSVDSESERLKKRSDDRRHRSTKNRRKGKHEVQSSDNGSDRDTLRQHEKKSKGDRRSSRSKNDLDFSNVGLEISQGQGINDTNTKNLSPINKSNEEATTSETVEACCRNSSSHSVDGEAKVDLEQTYRVAALKKLEEMRRLKDTPLVQSSVEIHSNEKVAVEDAEGSNEGEELSASKETRKSVASDRRKRI